MPVVMHPGGADNIIKDGALRGRGDLGNIIGNPLETTYFLTRLIFDGTFDKFPGLRVCAAHAGGYLPSYLGRTEAACVVRGNANCANKRRPSEYLKSQIMVDTMVFSDEGLRHLVAEMGVGQVVYGTDVPFNWPVTVDLVLNAPFLSDADKVAIPSGNLMKLLKIIDSRLDAAGPNQDPPYAAIGPGLYAVGWVLFFRPGVASMKRAVRGVPQDRRHTTMGEDDIGDFWRAA